MEINRLDHVERLASTLSVLGESARLSIVVYLMDKPASVGEITEQFPKHQEFPFLPKVLFSSNSSLLNKGRRSQPVYKVFFLYFTG